MTSDGPPGYAWPEGVRLGDREEAERAGRGKKAVDEDLLLALACGFTVEQAAARAGVSTRTLHRRLRNPEFRGQLQAMRDDMVQRASGMLTRSALQAVGTSLNLPFLRATSCFSKSKPGDCRSTTERCRQVGDRMGQVEQSTCLHMTVQDSAAYQPDASAREQGNPLLTRRVSAAGSCMLI